MRYGSLAVSALLLLALPAGAQPDAIPSVKATYLRRVEAKKPFPSTMHFRLELANPTDRLVWLATPFGPDAKFPEGGRFRADVDEGFPFSCVRLDGGAKGGIGSAYVVSFLGYDRFTAFGLPPKSKVVIEEFEIAGDDMRRFDVWETSSILVQGKTPLEKWLPFSPICDADARIPKGVTWIDALEDPNTNEPRADLPKEKAEFVTVERTRTTTVALEGYQSPQRHFAKRVAGKEPILYGWEDAGSFPSVNNAKISNLAFSKDGRSLMAAMENLKLARLNLANGEEESPTPGQEPLGRWLGFDAKGIPLIRRLEGYDEEAATLVISEWPSGKVRRKLRVEHVSGLWHGKSVLSPDGTRLALLHSKVVQLVDLEKEGEPVELRWRNAGPGQLVLDAVFSPDSTKLAVGFGGELAEGGAVVWDLSTKKAVNEFRTKQSSLQFLAFSPDGSELAATGKHPITIWVFAVSNTGRDRVLRNDRPAEMRTLAWSPDGMHIAVNTFFTRVGSNEGAIYLLQAVAGQAVGSLPGFAEWAGPIAFSPDGSTLAAADARGTIRVWKKEKAK
ncbi:MAG: WD40 repeat domain-containing protein [Gemmataceae bacterium]|nr:WD40 repeat domain-containing protein [Gemmataceae bacterium]